MDYTNIERVLKNKPKDLVEFNNNLHNICNILDIKPTEEDGTYMTILDYFSDITFQTLKYLRETGQIKF